MKKAFLSAALIAAISIGVFLPCVAQDGAVTGAKPSAAATLQMGRPHYALQARIDFDLLTFQGAGQVTIPVLQNESLKDVVFFVYANAGGVGGEDERRKNIAVDSVSLGGQAVPFTLNGAVLRVNLPQAQTRPFTLEIKWHGVVPRSPAGGGGLADMMGGDIGSLLGGASQPGEKPKNVDYGLYTYGNGILSLGAFWYPTLAVRQHGQWIDEAPEGLGDVAFSVMSDYEVALNVSQPVKVAAPGTPSMAQSNALSRWHLFRASNVRDFAVLMSEDFEVQTRNVDVGGKSVAVTAFVLKKHADKTAKVLDIAAHSLQTYDKVFGAYAYSSFKLAEGPMRSGAGGMEYSGMTSIASSLFEDLGKQLGGLADSLGVPGLNAADLDKLIGDEDGPSMAGPAAPGGEGAAANPAADFLGGMMGQQKEMFDSILEVTIAHEVAHQWWAIAVGSDSQRAPWLDESLTNYSSMLYFEDRYGKEKAAKMIDLNLKAAYSTGRMLGLPDAPVNGRTSAYSNNMQYGAIVYGKGALFYDALRKLTGDQAFFAALRDYYGRFDNKLATAQSLLGAFKGQSPQKAAQIDALYQRWIVQTHGDDDITGGKPAGIEDLLGGMLGMGME